MSVEEQQFREAAKASISSFFIFPIEEQVDALVDALVEKTNQGSSLLEAPTILKTAFKEIYEKSLNETDGFKLSNFNNHAYQKVMADLDQLNFEG